MPDGQLVHKYAILAGQDYTVVGSDNSTISTGGAATAAFRNTSKTPASALLVRVADNLTLASPINSGDSIYAVEYPVNSVDGSKTQNVSISHSLSGDIIMTKAANPKARLKLCSPGPAASKFLATSPPVESGDRFCVLKSLVNSGDSSKKLGKTLHGISYSLWRYHQD